MHTAKKSMDRIVQNGNRSFRRFYMAHRIKSDDKREGGERIAAANAEPLVSRRPASTSQLISPCLPCLVCTACLQGAQPDKLICQLMHRFSLLRKDCVSN